jgi:hypothetical protein
MLLFLRRTAKKTYGNSMVVITHRIFRESLRKKLGPEGCNYGVCLHLGEITSISPRKTRPDHLDQLATIRIKRLTHPRSPRVGRQLSAAALRLVLLDHQLTPQSPVEPLYRRGKGGKRNAKYWTKVRCLRNLPK